jgi:hypothetical protein
MILDRDQRRTLVRTGRVTTRVLVEWDGENILPCKLHAEITPSAETPGRSASVVAIQPRAGRGAICHARVVHVKRELLEWVVTLEKTASPEPARFLAKGGGGYTSNPAMGLDEEPEAVPPDWQDYFCEESAEKNDQIKRERIAEMRRGIDNAAAGIEETDLSRLDRKDLQRIEFYMRRIEERAA